jgi:hypothetical protein
MYICIRLIAVLFLALFINPAYARANKPEAKNKGTTKTAVNSTAAKPAKTTTKSTSKNSPVTRPKATVKDGPKSQSANTAKSVAVKKAVAKAAAPTSNKPLPKQVEKKSVSAVLFAVSQNNSRSFIDPIVIIKDGKYTRPPAGDAPTAQLTRFANTYYREGQTYRLLFGGGEAGTVTVKQWNLRKACSRTEADAEIAGESKISGKVMGLATNSKEIGKRSRSRRFPTERERSAAEGLIKKLFKQKGVTEAQITHGFTKVNLTATDLNGDKKAELIATYLVKRLPGGTAAHILFSILEPDGKTYKVSTSQYGHITARDIGSEAMLDELGGSALAEVLVDQIDLDKDGTAEVIIADLTKEGVVYKIFKKEKKGWQRAYEFANYRCGY